MRKTRTLFAGALATVAVVAGIASSPAVAAGGPTVTAAPPTVVAVHPDAGVLAGGTRLTVEATNLGDVSAVLFGGTPGTNVTVTSDSSLMVTAPPHPAGLVDVTVVTAGGPSWHSAEDRFTYSTLTPKAAPVPADAASTDPDLGALTCPVPGWCLATGEYIDPAQRGPGALEILSDGVWTAVRAPLPAGTDPIRSEYVSLPGTACPAPGTCLAVGAYIGNDGPAVPLIESLTGGVWTPLVPPLPSDADQSGDVGAQLVSVACPTRQWCVAVGTYSGTDGSGHGLVETYSHGLWTAARSATPAGTGTGGRLMAVACTAARSCVTVGDYANPGEAGHGLIDTLSGNVWTPLAAPTAPGSAGAGTVGLLSCPVPRWCTAIGGLRAYTLSGGTWTVRTMPLPADRSTGGGGLKSLACPAPRSCVAVGQYSSKAVSRVLGRGRALIETLINGEWVTSGAAVPYASDLWSVACATPGSCVAVGMQNFPGSPNARPTEGLIETLTSGAWGYGNAPVPADGSTGFVWTWLRRVSCPRGACVAIGTYIGSGGLIERWHI